MTNKTLWILLSSLLLLLQGAPSSAAPVNCVGNACADLDITNIEYHQGGTTISEVTLINNGNVQMSYKIHWASVFGQCNVRNDGVISAGQSKKIDVSLARYVAWCKVEANRS